MLAIFWELSSEGLYQSSRKEKESCCPVFPSSTKRELGTTKKRDARAELLFCQSKPFAFLPYSLPSKLPSSLNSDAVRSRHFQLSFPTFTWYEGDCNGT